MRGYFTSIILLMLVVFMVIGSQMYVLHQEQGEEVNAFNYTEETFSNTTKTMNKETKEKYNLSGRAEIVLNEFTGLFIELFKWAFEFGYENPQYDFVFFSLALLFVLFLPFLLPFLAVVYIIARWLINKLKKRKKEVV